MSKKHSKKKNHKPFNPIHTVEKLHEPRPKLKNSKTDNNWKDPKDSSSPSGENKELVFSKGDREIILHIRSLLSQNGEMPEYLEKTNEIEFAIEGVFDTHHLGVSCYSNVLKIFSLKQVNAINRCSNEAFKYITNLSFKIQMGGFCYSPEGDSFIYYLGIPLYEKPKRQFVESIIKHVIKILDNYVPEIISCIHGTNHLKKED